MKRLCVFYRRADLWVRKPIEWIVCKECQKRLSQGLLEHLHLKAIEEQRENAPRHDDDWE